MTDLDLLTLGADVATLASPFDQPTATATLADEAKLDRCLAALDSDDATITDVRAVLYLLGRGLTPVDPIRHMGICMRLSAALGRFGPDVSNAPPAALNDVVRDSLVGCRNDLCAEKVAPWSDCYNGCCGPDCETAWLRTVGS